MFCPPLSTLPTAASGDAWSLIMAIRCGTSKSPLTPSLAKRFWTVERRRHAGTECRPEASDQRARPMPRPDRDRRMTKPGDASRSASTLSPRQRALPHRAAVVANAERQSVRLGGLADLQLRLRTCVRVARHERPRRTQLPIDPELEAAVLPVAAQNQGHAHGVDTAQAQAAVDSSRHGPRPANSNLIARRDEAQGIRAHAPHELRVHRRALATLRDAESERRRVLSAPDAPAAGVYGKVGALRADRGVPRPELRHVARVDEIDAARIGRVRVSRRLVARREYVYAKRSALVAEQAAILAADRALEEIRPPAEL